MFYRPKIIISIILFSQLAKAQESHHIGEREGNVFFSISSEYRITPIFGLTTERSTINNAIEVNEQNSGASLNYAFDWFISQDFSLGFSNSLRYDHIAIGNIDTIDGTEKAAPNENGILLDFHLYGQYHFKVFKESELFIQLGASLLHIGSDLVVSTGLVNGDLLERTVIESNASYIATNIGLGWKKKRIALMLGFYTSRSTPYFLDDSRFTVPYVRFSYNLFKL